jgi:diaminopimelate decarboxylase
MNRSIDILLKIKKWGTPTYIYDENQLRKGFQELRNALPECVDIFMRSKLIRIYRLSN